MTTSPDQYAVIGHPVDHSRSPALHNLFARQSAEKLSYGKIDAPPGHFFDTVQAFIATGGRGFNITLPFKVDAFELVDEATPRATHAQSINTVMVGADGRLTGDNTDGAGLVRDLSINHNIRVGGRRLLILGAGGAARGIIGPLLDEAPATIHIANRTAERARQLARRDNASHSVSAGSYADLAGGSFDLVINATSASLRAELPPLPQGLLRSDAICYDLAYADTPTVFLDWAHAQGAVQALDGWGMLVEQAAESFYLWRGVRPETRAALNARPSASA